ncbi:MAG: lipopolysaccharide heptosyltransferase II [Fidelibacterota bacterium]
MNEKSRNFLIIQTAYIGDVILTTHLAELIKSKIPSNRVNFLVIPSTSELLKNNPYVDNIIVYDKRGRDKGLTSLLKIISKLRKNRYHIAVIPHRSFRSALIACLSGIPVKIGFSNSAGFMLLNRRIKYTGTIHEFRRNSGLLEVLGYRENSVLPKLFPGRKDRRKIDSIFHKYRIKQDSIVISIAPGSKWNTKRWPEERFHGLIYRLILNMNAFIILIGGEEDRALCRKIALSSGRLLNRHPQFKNNRLINMAGKLSLLQSSEVIRRSRLLISNDSAALHMASAMRTKAVAIFGPTIPDFGFYPIEKGSRIIEKDLPCRPCGIHGGTECPVKTFDCMRGIEVKDVLEAAVEILKSGNY